MAKKKKEVEVPERSALESLAKEMNEVMGLDPKIKFNRKTTDEELVEMIKENAVDEESGEPCIYHSDFEEDADDPDKEVFSEEAKETLEALEIEIGDEPEDEEGAEAEEEEKPAKKGKKEEKPAKKGRKDEEDEEEDEKPTKKGKKDEKPSKSGKGKKEEVEEEEEDEKPAKKSGKSDKKADKEKPAKKEKKGVTRYQAVAAVLREGKALTEDQLAEKADDFYSKKGGNSGLAQSERIVDRSLQLLRALELVEEKGGKIKYTGE